MNCLDATRLSLERIAADEPDLHAWAHLDPDGALERAQLADRALPGPLAGLTLGVKDNIDTCDLPSEYGSAIYRGFRPRADAAAVALLRSAGITLVGKTTTVEFAYVGTGPTRNPHSAQHTPGGSSMGSAAAVAAGHVDVALGTQTGGSIVRPASYCGVFGYKPTFGTTPTAGVKQLCPSLDTVGWFARDLDLLDLVRTTMTTRPFSPVAEQAPRIGLLRTRDWERADTDSQRAVIEAAVCLGRPKDLGDPETLRDLAPAQVQVMAYEAYRSLAWERTERRRELTSAVREELDRASIFTAEQYDAALARRDRARRSLMDTFGDVDVVVCPVVTGEAPLGHSFTGDPLFARQWTLLGLPTICVPWTVGKHELPIGVQVVGRAGEDARLIAATRQIANKSPWVQRARESDPRPTSLG